MSLETVRKLFFGSLIVIILVVLIASVVVFLSNKEVEIDPSGTRDTSPSAVGLDLLQSSLQDRASDFDKLERFLPFGNFKYRVEAEVVGGEKSVIITLHAIFNRPSQYKSFKKQLKQYGKEALDWIRSKDVDPEKLNIIWKPEDPNL